MSIQLRLRHLTTPEAEEVWEAVQTPAGSDLADNLAVTIASWWQSPGPVGRHLAALASGGIVTARDLIADIDATIAELRALPRGGEHSAEEFGDGPSAEWVLGWLRAWAEDWGTR